jgi:hypothetical protein
VRDFPIRIFCDLVLDICHAHVESSTQGEKCGGVSFHGTQGSAGTHDLCGVSVEDISTVQKKTVRSTTSVYSSCFNIDR